MNPSIRLERLNHLVEVLELVPDENLEMCHWVSPTPLRAKVFFARKPLPDNFTDLDCNSAGCALGWSAADKEFRKEGLYFNKSWPMGSITFKGYSDYNAARVFFMSTQE